MKGTKTTEISSPPGNQLLKKRLAAGETLYGIFLLSGSAAVAECCATLPIDWLAVDMEASPIGFSDVVGILRALNGSSVAPIVRVADLQRPLIEQTLDLGAEGVIVPKIDLPDMAARALSYSLYPPHGERGVNPVRCSGYFSDIPGYLASANDTTVSILQVESVSAVEQVDEIAALKPDVLFVGCGDLAMSLGQPGNVTGPEMDRARALVLEACATNGVTPGIFAYSLELAEQYKKEGFRFIAIGNDFKLLKSSLSDALGTLKVEG